MNAAKLFILMSLLLTTGCYSAKSGQKSNVVTTIDSIEAVNYPEELKVSYYFIQGVRKFEVENDNEAAKKYLLKVLETDQKHAPAMFYLANVLDEEGIRELALEYSIKANMLDSTTEDYKAQLCNFLMQNAHYEAAEEAHKYLISISPQNPLYYMNLANVYYSLNKPYSSIAVLDSAEQKVGIVPEMWNMKRAIMADLGLVDRAIAESEKHLELFPDDVQALSMLASMYMSKNMDSLAENTYDKALKLDPKNIRLLLSYSDLAQKKGRTIEFLTMCKQILSNESGLPLQARMQFFNDVVMRYYYNNPEIVNKLATEFYEQNKSNSEIKEFYIAHLYMTGKREDAISMYKESIYDPDKEVSKKALGTVIALYQMANNLDSTMKYLDIATLIHPKEFGFYFDKGIAYDRLGKHEKSIGQYKTAMKYASSDSIKSQIESVIGQSYFAQGNKKMCFKHYKNALKYNPNNVLVLNNYAYYLSLDSVSLDKALKMSELANKLETNNPTYLDTQAWVLYKMGEYEKAKTVMRTAIALDSNGNAELFSHYGDILFKTGDLFLAKIYWQKALEKGGNKEELERKLKETNGK